MFKWFRKKIIEIGKIDTAVLLAVVFLFLFFGAYQIEKAALSDEHYWVFDRAPKFWQNIAEIDPNGTRRSDKPGVTLMALSGVSLLRIDNPVEFKWASPEEKEVVNRIFRWPILVFVAMSLLVIYWLIRKLLNRTTALFSVIFIGLSPILIGMSRIVNPDSLLWVFSTFSILSFLIYLKEEQKKFLVFSGIMLGLALMTKYVANILLIFFLGVIFLEYIFQKDKAKKGNYFKRLYISYLALIGTGPLTFAVLYPAVWAKPVRLLKGTLWSDAFAPIWIPYLIILAILLIDSLFFRAKITSSILDFFSKRKKWLGQALCFLSLAFISVVFLNVWLGNRWFDFVAPLASPKSAHQTESLGAIFMSNFYPILFGISPLVLFFIVWFLIKGFWGKIDFSKNNAKTIVFLLGLILLYYIGSFFTHIASPIRYQIILFPVILLMGGIATNEMAGKYLRRKKAQNILFLALTIFILIFPLYYSRPFYMAYASNLLPGQYHIDQKDMGYGSYEAAIYLNELPDADKLVVWSDKKGVCDYFVGQCYMDLDADDLEGLDFDYYIMSSGRSAKVIRLTNIRVGITGGVGIIRFDKLYKEGDIVWELKMAQREGNYVKIIDAKSIDIRQGLE